MSPSRHHGSLVPCQRSGLFRRNGARPRWRPIRASLRPLGVCIYAVGSQSCATRLALAGSAPLTAAKQAAHGISGRVRRFSGRRRPAPARPPRPPVAFARGPSRDASSPGCRLLASRAFRGKRGEPAPALSLNGPPTPSKPPSPSARCVFFALSAAMLSHRLDESDESADDRAEGRDRETASRHEASGPGAGLQFEVGDIPGHTRSDEIWYNMCVRLRGGWNRRSTSLDASEEVPIPRAAADCNNIRE